MNFKMDNIMKQITKVFIFMCLCLVLLSCGKDDNEEKTSGKSICTECSAYAGGSWTTPAQFCGPESEVLLFEERYKSINSQPGISVRCVRKKQSM